MRLLFGIFYGLHLLLGSSTSDTRPCPSPEFFAEYLYLDRRAAVEYIKLFAGSIDMFPLIPTIIRAREYSLFGLIHPSIWLKFLKTKDSKCILGPDVFAHMEKSVLSVRNGEIRPEILPSMLKASLEQDDGTSDRRLICFLKDAAVTYPWDSLGIFGQIGLYQTCSILNTAYKKQIKKAYTFEHPLKGCQFSFQKIFKHWKLVPAGSREKEDLQLFLGLHHDFRHYAKYIFGQSLDDYHHFPWDHSLANTIKSVHNTSSPVIQMLVYGIDPDIIRVLIKAYPEYMREGWSVNCAHTIVIGYERKLSMSFIKTALKQGEVDFSTLEDYSQLSKIDPELICLLVDQIVKPAIWRPLSLSLLLVCVWNKVQLEEILDAIPSKSFKVSVPAIKHLLAVGVDFVKISRPFIGVGIFIFGTIEESMVNNLLRRGLTDENFVIQVLGNISPIWKPTQSHVQLAFDLGYSHRVIYCLSKPRDS